MSERLSDDRPDWQRQEAAVAHAREAVGDGLQVGTVSVKYDGDFWAAGAVWIRADCSECGSSVVMQASHQLHVRQLALDLARYGCSKVGHMQALDVMQRQIDFEMGIQLDEGDEADG